ncbi:hypothetical protein [Kitasatospora acidiphila]|uniref:hypothetical protein n=1 Tax=Kitasatospora acidiphila TaxID=2567942 RepID=UPI001E374F41|nr:hypothetical protein [Kitasatospora acidiphila]
MLGQIVPAISAAVGAYGTGVLTRAEDAAADETIRLGQRLLDRILRRRPEPVPVRNAVSDLAEAGGDPDALAALRFQIRQVLVGDQQFAAELAELLPPGATVHAAGDRSVAVGGTNSGIISTGDQAVNVQRR